MPNTASIFADGIRLRWMPTLNQVVDSGSTSVSDWLETGAYTWVPSASPGTGLIDLRTCRASFAEAIAAEISRFSCGAYESLLGAAPTSQAPRSLAWPMIRHYYAAFYCGHALLRVGGQSLTYLSSKTIAKLNKVGAQYLGVSPQLASGLHLVHPSPRDPNTLVIEPISKGGGSHEDMWQHFLGFITEIENLILQTQGTSADARSAVQKSVLLRAHLCQAGKTNGGWLSSVRNSVNYRHEYGVWFPYQVDQNFSTTIGRRMARWTTNDPDCFSIASDQGDLGQLVDICNFLARFLLATLLDISNRSPIRSKSFVERQTFALLRQRRVKLA